MQDNAPLAAGQTVPGTPARAHAWVGDAGALLDYKDASRSALTYEISYAPEVVRYDGYSSENHTDSLLSANLKGTQDLWSYGAKASVFYVDGSNDSPVYNRLGGGPAIGAPTVAFRRKHIDTRASAQLTRELTDDFFVRDVVNTLARDYHTHQSAQADYANYISVSETTVGADIGWRVQKDFALLAGVRGGVQTQENILGVNLNYSNTLARFLVGAEGNLRPNLKLTV
ncbi:MAG: hypothetical protein ABSE59_07105, partial [Opitutaceae bacterium]